MKKHKLRLLLITCGILAGGFLIYILAKLGHPIHCPFYQITGLSCPGCGSTRAVLALLRLDIAGALSYNLMLPVCLFYLGFVYVRCAVSCLKTGKFTYRSPIPALDWIVLTAILLWWIVRNILHI